MVDPGQSNRWVLFPTEYPREIEAALRNPDEYYPAGVDRDLYHGAADLNVLKYWRGDSYGAPTQLPVR